jgi:hypothetical protein
MVEDSTHLPEIGRTAADDDGNDEEGLLQMYQKSYTLTDFTIRSICK